jgi:hypothetical protein
MNGFAFPPPPTPDLDESRYRMSSYDAVQQLRGSRKAEMKATIY